MSGDRPLGKLILDTLGTTFMLKFENYVIMPLPQQLSLLVAIPNLREESPRQFWGFPNMFCVASLFSFQFSYMYSFSCLNNLRDAIIFSILRLYGIKSQFSFFLEENSAQLMTNVPITENPEQSFPKRSNSNQTFKFPTFQTIDQNLSIQITQHKLNELNFRYLFQSVLLVVK